MINDLWYKNAVIYCLSVGAYMDANGDGIGDFPGLMRRLDYLHGLGVTAIWLMPFQTSPCRDDGYDVSDFYGVDPRNGTLGDFVEFTHGTKQRGPGVGRHMQPLRLAADAKPRLVHVFHRRARHSARGGDGERRRGRVEHLTDDLTVTDLSFRHREVQRAAFVVAARVNLRQALAAADTDHLLKQTTLEEIGEMLSRVVEHMATRDDIKDMATKGGY